MINARSVPMKPGHLPILLLCAPLHAIAVDSVSIEAGRGTSDIHIVRVGVQWHGRDKWFEHSSWHVARYIDLTFGGWQNGHGTVYDLGFTPVFRFARASGSPYIEAAVGFHALSDLDFGRGRETSTRFQFGDHIGVGVVRGRYDWALRLQHLSNAGIRNPNPGINFVQVRLQYWLD
jgi:lipid A 3-O-deacylase